MDLYKKLNHEKNVHDIEYISTWLPINNCKTIDTISMEINIGIRLQCKQ